MLPFPTPNESVNRALEGLEQQTIEDDVQDLPNQADDQPQPDQAGAETQSASDETLDHQD